MKKRRIWLIVPLVLALLLLGLTASKDFRHAAGRAWVHGDNWVYTQKIADCWYWFEQHW